MTIDQCSLEKKLSDINSTLKTLKSKDSWLKPLIVGALIGVSVNVLTSYFINRLGDETQRHIIASDLLTEIRVNQEISRNQIVPVQKAINDVRNGVEFLSSPSPGNLHTDIYKFHFDKLGLLDESIRSDVLTHYANLYLLTYHQGFVKDVIFNYSNTPRRASAINAEESLETLHGEYVAATVRGEIIQAELMNKYGVKLSIFDSEEFSKAKNRISESLKNSTTSSLEATKLLANANGVYAALALLELGFKPIRPLNGKFEK